MPVKEEGSGTAQGTLAIKRSGSKPHVALRLELLLLLAGWLAGWLAGRSLCSLGTQGCLRRCLLPWSRVSSFRSRLALACGAGVVVISKDLAEGPHDRTV